MSRGTDRILTESEIIQAVRQANNDQAQIIQEAMDDSKLVMNIIKRLTLTIKELQGLTPSVVTANIITDVVTARRNLGGLFRSLGILRTYDGIEFEPELVTNDKELQASFTMTKDQFEFTEQEDGLIGLAECLNCGDVVVYNDGCVKCNAVFIFKDNSEDINNPNTSPAPEGFFTKLLKGDEKDDSKSDDSKTDPA